MLVKINFHANSQIVDARSIYDVKDFKIKKVI